MRLRIRVSFLRVGIEDWPRMLLLIIPRTSVKKFKEPNLERIYFLQKMMGMRLLTHRNGVNAILNRKYNIAKYTANSIVEFTGTERNVIEKLFPHDETSYTKKNSKSFFIT
jgi:hypothetical protein